MNMFWKIIKSIWFIGLIAMAKPEIVCAQFDIDWTGMATSVIDESSKSDVQKIFSSLSSIHLSDNKINEYRKIALEIGLKNPMTVDALMTIEHGVKPYTVSSLPIITNHKITDLGNKRIRSLSSDFLYKKRQELEKTLLSDYLNDNTLEYLKRIDADGMLSGKLLDEIKRFPKLAVLLNNNPIYLDFLKKNIKLAQIDGGRLLMCLVHLQLDDNCPLTLSKPIEWDYTINGDGTMLISSQIGTLAKLYYSQPSVNEPQQTILKIDLPEVPTFLNYDLPPFSRIIFGGVAMRTDPIGRLVEVSFPVAKYKFKDLKKQQLKVKDILLAKEESSRKPWLIVHKKFGGTETWSNVISIEDTKANKQAIKELEKKLESLSKSDGNQVVVKLTYDTTASNPTSIQYFNEDKLICTLK